MIGVARNVLRNSRRSQYRRTNFDQHSRAAPRTNLAAEDPGQSPTSAVVVCALEILNDDDREVLMLNAWDGLDTHALGIALSITTNAAAVRLSRAAGPFSRAFCGGSSHLKVSGASRHELGYAGGGAFMSDFEERLRAADPAATSSYPTPRYQRDDLDASCRAPRAGATCCEASNYGWPIGRPSRALTVAASLPPKVPYAVLAVFALRRTAQRGSVSGLRCQIWYARFQFQHHAHLRGVRLQCGTGPQYQLRTGRPTSYSCPPAPRPKTRASPRSSVCRVRRLTTTTRPGLHVTDSSGYYVGLRDLRHGSWS